MKPTSILSVLAVTLSLSAPAAFATSASLEKCVNAAIRGPSQVKFQKILGHKFHCKPAQYVKLGDGRTKIAGQLSHVLKWVPDDQLYYEFVLRRGMLEKDSVKTRVKDGGFDPFAGVAASAIGAYFGVPVSPQTAAQVWDKAAKTVSGRGWNETAALIVATIALKAASQQHSSAPRDHRGQQAAAQ